MYDEPNAAASCLAFFERAMAREKVLAASRERARLEMQGAIKKMLPAVKPERARPQRGKPMEYKIKPTPEQLALFDRADAERWTLKQLAAAVGWSVSKVWILRTERDHQRKTKRLRAHRRKYGPGHGKPAPPATAAIKNGRRTVVLTPDIVEWFGNAIDTNVHVDEICAKVGIARKTFYQWRLHYWHDKNFLRDRMKETAQLEAARG